jgi:hypothetical protein
LDWLSWSTHLNLQHNKWTATKTTKQHYFFTINNTLYICTYSSKLMTVPTQPQEHHLEMAVENTVTILRQKVKMTNEMRTFLLSIARRNKEFRSITHKQHSLQPSMWVQNLIRQICLICCQCNVPFFAFLFLGGQYLKLSWASESETHALL